MTLILASTSTIRQKLLRDAGLDIEIRPSRVDEEMITRSLQSEQAKPRDIADALAEAKAQKISNREATALVLGCDQVLSLGSKMFGKPHDPDDAKSQLRMLSGQEHHLHSAVVAYEDGTPQWRHIGHVRLQMRVLSDAYIDEYVARNWPKIQHCVGCYQLESEGIRLFSGIIGDYFSVLGLPMIPLLSWLVARGTINI